MPDRRLLLAALLLLGAGCDFLSPPSGPVPVAAVSEERGELARLVHDRPKLRAELARHPKLRRWVRDRFRERRTGLLWDPTMPASGQPAEHVPPAAAGGPVMLRLTTELTGRDQLGLVVYELVNMRNGPAIDTLWSDARAGKHSRSAFAVEMVRLEHAALVTFQEVARSHDLAASPDDRMLVRLLEAPESFDAYRAWLKALHAQDGGGYDPFVYWEKAYDDYVPAANAAAAAAAP